MAYVTGMVNQGLLLRNEYLAAENGSSEVRSRVGCCFRKVKRLPEIGDLAFTSLPEGSPKSDLDPDIWKLAGTVGYAIGHVLERGLM